MGLVQFIYLFGISDRYWGGIVVYKALLAGDGEDHTFLGVGWLLRNAGEERNKDFHYLEMGIRNLCQLCLVRLLALLRFVLKFVFEPKKHK